MSEVKVNKISPRSGTDVTLGDSGDNFNVPSGAAIAVTGDLKSSTLKDSAGAVVISKAGTTVTLGASGDTVSVAGGATLEGAGLAWQTIITGSTLTSVAGNAYWIDTTSNTCTITLPSSASNGDQIIFADYARTWGTNKIIIDSNGLNYQGEDDTLIVEYDTNGQTINIIYSGATKGWIPLDDDASALEPTEPVTQKAIFGYGSTGSNVSLTNLVNSSGVVASDTTGVGTARVGIGAAGYGGDKGIFAYGNTGGAVVSMSNLVSNTGVVSADVTGVGTARSSLAAAAYGSDKAIFAYGLTPSQVSMSNLVNNSGVVAADVTGVGTARGYPGAVGYGSDKAIFAYGNTGGAVVSMSNLVSNTGVVSADVTGVGTARYDPVGSIFGSTGQAILAYGGGVSGNSLTGSNLISNTGVVASDTGGVGTARQSAASAAYGGDKGIIGYGYTTGVISLTTLINNSGVLSSDVTGVGTARQALGAIGYSRSA